MGIQIMIKKDPTKTARQVLTNTSHMDMLKLENQYEKKICLGCQLPGEEEKEVIILYFD